MEIRKLIQQIKQFKIIYQEYYIKTIQQSIPAFCLDKPLFEFKHQATEKDIKLLSAELSFMIPNELSAFYKEIGQLVDENQPEILTIWIPSVNDLLSKKGNSRWTQTSTFGLIDMMKLHWGNDRYELNEGQFLTTEQITKLNETYMCIGYWCKNPFYEEAYFIIFFKKHQFSEIVYNQDRFDLLKVQLLDILENGIPQNSFEKLLKSIFTRLEGYSIEYAENL